MIIIIRSKFFLVDSNISDYTEIQREVIQECIISPILLYRELIFRQFGQFKGNTIRGKDIINLRYFDDTILISETKKGLQNPLIAAKFESEKAEL